MAESLKVLAGRRLAEIRSCPVSEGHYRDTEGEGAHVPRPNSPRLGQRDTDTPPGWRKEASGNEQCARCLELENCGVSVLACSICDVALVSKP